MYEYKIFWPKGISKRFAEYLQKKEWLLNNIDYYVRLSAVSKAFGGHFSLDFVYKNFAPKAIFLIKLYLQRSLKVTEN